MKESFAVFESLEDIHQMAKGIDTDEVDKLLVLSDALEDIGYPNVVKFRDAVERLRLAHIQGMHKGEGGYGGLYWEIRRRVIRHQTEIEHWLNRAKAGEAGVPWSGPFQE